MSTWEETRGAARLAAMASSPRFYDDEDELRYGLRRYQEERRENEKGGDLGAGQRGYAAAVDNKIWSKRGAPHTRGTAISFGFRRKAAATGIPVPIAGGNRHLDHQRSKSVGPEHESRYHQADDEYYQSSARYQNYSSSGRSTPRLAPPKKESSGLPIRTNRFGFRSQQRFTDKVTDLSTFNSHTVNNFNQGKNDHFQNHDVYHDGSFRSRQSRSPAQTHQSKPRPSPTNQPIYNNNNNPPNFEMSRKNTELSTTVGKYTLHTSHLPQPQYAVRVADASSKIAKTAVNQSRKVGISSRTGPIICSSKEGSGTEDSGLGSQHGGCSDENGASARLRYEYFNGRQAHSRPRKLGVVMNGKSFDVRDIDNDHTITEISVIPLTKNFVQTTAQQMHYRPQHTNPHLNITTGLVRERANQYQRIALNKDNRYITDSTTSMSTTSMSTTSSEGYDEGLGEEKVYKDRSRTEKLMAASSSSSCMMRSTDFSPPSSDEQEFGHGGEAMADEYSFSSNDDYSQPKGCLPIIPCNTVTQTTSQHFKAITNAAKSGALPKSTLRSVLLTIEDPAFAAVAATTTTLIDDETSPVDSLFDSPTASVSQSDIKVPKKENIIMEKSGNTLDDDSPGTPTNASNSLSLSEGREFFDDEIADQPGLVFDETLRDISTTNTEYSQTVMETTPKKNSVQGKSVENSPMYGRKMNRVGSVSTLSSCESLASDDLMMDYERSDASSFGDVNSRGNSTYVVQDLDDATSLLELDIQGQEVMKEWNNMLGDSLQAISNSTNNNINVGLNNNQNIETGLSNNRSTRLLSSRSSTDSPRSLDSTKGRQIFSPLRPLRNAQSPGLDSGDEGSPRVERGTYSYMFQDIVSIKTMLLKLKRVLQESGENGMTRADPLNPFDNSLKNGLSYNLNDGGATTDSSAYPNEARDSYADELAELRRQVTCLQGQVEDKDRVIKSLQAQLAKQQQSVEAAGENSPMRNGRRSTETFAVATQTEKLRPVSMGPSILQGYSQDSGTGSYASWHDSSIVAPRHQHQQHQSHQPHRRQCSSPPRPEPSSPPSCPSPGAPAVTVPGLRASAPRRAASSSDVQSPHLQRPSSLRGLRPPSGQACTSPTTPPDSRPVGRASASSAPEDTRTTTTTTTTTGAHQAASATPSPTRSSIPTPRRLVAPTLIPRHRAVSTGRATSS